MATPIDFHVLRIHRLGQRDDLLILTEFVEALAAVGRVLRLLLSLRDSEVHRPVVVQ